MASLCVCVRARACVCWGGVNTQNAAKFVTCCAACFGKGMSDDRFCAQCCWITLFKCMALITVNTSLANYNPNALEHEVINSVAGVIEISVN